MKYCTNPEIAINMERNILSSLCIFKHDHIFSQMTSHTLHVLMTSERTDDVRP